MSIDPYVVTSADDDLRLQAMDFVVNQYVMFDEEACRFDGTSLVKTKWTRIKDFSPKTIEQRCLFDLLDNDDIPIKVVMGVAGSGKTKAAVSFGLDKLGRKSSKFDRLLIIRQPAVAGEEIGFLKGTLSDKLAPWQSAIVDNLEGGRPTFEYLVKTGAIEFDIPAFVQGRDIKRSFIIVDEAQNLTTKEAKMLGTRCAEGSVIVFIGDVDQVVHKRYERDNGLTAVVGALKGTPEFGFMRLTKSVRSRVAELFAGRL